jgi:hypothetical protein
MKKCIFCGEKGGNKEHIIAQWLTERMGAQREHLIAAKIDGHGQLEKRPPHTLKNYTTRNVCRNCNNGWMSRLESWFQANMGTLVEPTWPSLANEFLKNALNGRNILAAWALKTATMMNSGSMLNSIEDEEMFNGLRAGYVVGSVVVDVAYLAERGIGHTMSRGFRVVNGNKPPQWQARHDKRAYTCLMQFNHLAIRVFRCVGAEPFYRSINKRVPLRMYPVSANPYETDYRFHNQRELEESLFLTTNVALEQG